ncbi:hypothetical protein HY386_02035 [Candidatus Daviesbacteria bacterium]|nr:hypothetical protein [Candidatus Daviesbacteria bacterium]
MNKHLLIQIDKNSWKLDINLPDRKIPRSFRLDRNGYICLGYFISWEEDLTDQQIFQYCKDRDFETLANLTADFLIIFIDQSNKKVTVLNSQTGTFPCYFAFIEDNLIISTSFYEIKKRLKYLTLNLNQAFDYFIFEFFNFPQDETILEEINQVPPAALLEVKPTFEYRISSLLKYREFYGEGVTPLESTEDFTNQVATLIEIITRERLTRLKQFSKAGELSSGYDSGLVASAIANIDPQSAQFYTWNSELDQLDSDPAVVKKFALKHELKVNFWEKDAYFPFAAEEDLKLSEDNFYPATFAQNLILEFYKYLSAEDKEVVFNGTGGDEIYMVHEMDDLYPYFVHLDYFDTVRALDWDIDRILTSKGIDILMDRDRFSKRNLYPVILSTSSLEKNYFPIYWEYNLWPVSPLTDPRLIKLARRMPKKDPEQLRKEHIWKHRTDIFLPEQLKPKHRFGTLNFVKQYVKKRKDFIIEVLRNSVLAKKGLIKADEIIKNLQEDKFDLYSDKNNLFFHNVIRLEYFIQKNLVKVL